MIVLDSDLLWIKDYDVRVPAPQPSRTDDDAVAGVVGTDRQRRVYHAAKAAAAQCPPAVRYKYCLSSMDSGAWCGGVSQTLS